MRKSFAGAATAALLAASALVAVGGPTVQADPPDCDWPMFGRTLGRSFAALDECSDVSATNVTTLQEKWAREDIGPVTAQPIVDDGVVYIGSNKGVFYALDAETGGDVWTFTVEDKNMNDYGVITASAAVQTIDDVKVVVFAGVATLYVLDAATGDHLAAECFDPAHVTPPEAAASGWDPCTDATTILQEDGSPSTVEIESSPAVVPNPTGETARLVIGMDYNEDPGVGPAGVVGLVLTRADAGSWRLNADWKYDPERQQTYEKTDTTDPLRIHGPEWKGCGNVWSSPTVVFDAETAPDVEQDIAVFGVGNCTDNGLTEAIEAVDLHTGQQVFRFTPRQGDPDAPDPDVDFGATPNVLPDGSVGEGGKDGHYYALDTAGDLQWDANAAMNSDLGGIIGSTAVGEARDSPAVFASSGIPVNTREAYTLSSFSQGVDQIVEGASNATVRIPPGALHAIDATTGNVLWDAPAPPSYGPVVYADGVVFLPDTFGFSMQAYHADTGALLWAMPLVTDAGPTAPAGAVAPVGDTIFFGSGMLLADPDNGGVWAFELPALPPVGG